MRFLLLFMLLFANLSFTQDEYEYYDETTEEIFEGEEYEYYDEEYYDEYYDEDETETEATDDSYEEYSGDEEYTIEEPIKEDSTETVEVAPPLTPQTITNTVYVTNTFEFTNSVTLPEIAPISINACIAILKGSLKDLQSFVVRDVDILYRQRGDGNNLMHIAASTKYTNIIIYLLEEGVDIHQTNNSGRLPIHISVLHDQLETTRILMNAQSSLYQKDINGLSAMGIANIRNNAEMLRMLAQHIPHENIISNAVLSLKKEINHTTIPSNFELYANFAQKVSERGPLLETPWHKAAYIPGYKEYEKLLLQGYDPNVKDKYGRTPYHIAALYNNSDALEYLLLKHPLSFDKNRYKDNFGALPLHTAAGKASPETIAALINQGCNPNEKNKGGWTALFEASFLNNLEGVLFLLNLGITPNVRTPQGRTPLHEAAAQGNAQLIDALLKAGALYDVADYQGKTPLYLAAQQGHLEALALLIDKGTDVNSTTKDDMNALHIAVLNNQINIVKYLLSSSKIDIFQADSSGRTPLDIAYILGNHDIISVLALEFARQSGVELKK